MSEANHISDWVRFYSSAPTGYKPSALEAVLKNDGEKVLHAVLKKLGLLDSVALVKDWNG